MSLNIPCDCSFQTHANKTDPKRHCVFSLSNPLFTSQRHFLKDLKFLLLLINFIDSSLLPPETSPKSINKREVLIQYASKCGSVQYKPQVIYKWPILDLLHHDQTQTFDIAAEIQIAKMTLLRATRLRASSLCSLTSWPEMIAFVYPLSLKA